MKKIFSTVLLLVLYSSNSYALDACSALNPVAKVNEKIKTDVEGSATTLFKFGAIDGDVKVSIEKETINIFQRHKDANKTVIKGKLIYLYCNVIQNSKTLSDLQKLNAIRKLYSENEELDIPENSSNVFEVSDIVYTLKSCKQKSQSIKCKFSIKNTAKDKVISLNSNSFIIDSDGDKYAVSNIKFGKITNRNFPKKLLLKNLSVKAEMVFNKVTTSGNTVPLLKFGAGNKFMEFRDIPLTN